MKILVSIVSCELFRVNGNNQAVRDTWLPLLKDADYKIFMGHGSSTTQPDEVLLNAPDDYKNVSYKTKEMYKYAYEKGYDYIFKCYPDTYVCPERLLSSGFQLYDYAGNFACRPLSGAYCCGGTGYWTSRRAYEQMLESRIPTEDTIVHFGRELRLPNVRAPRRTTPRPEKLVIPNTETWAEDKWTGDTLARLGFIKKYHDTRYEDNVMLSGPEAGNKKITQHLSRPIAEGKPSLYDKQWLYDKHNAWLRSYSVTKTFPKVAVITPTLPSRHELLEECRASVKAQDYPGDVYFAVGEDHTKVGPSAMRNTIVKELDSSYEWLAFCDDDDKLLPDHISTLMDNREDADIIYSECKEEGFVKTWNTRTFDYESVKRDNYIPVTVLMRRSMFDKIEGFKSEPFPGEDQWLWLRAASAGARFKYVPRTTWVYRKHPQHRFLST